MAFYGLDDRHVLAMPIKRFWLLNANLPRIQAAEHRMTLSTQACSQHGELISERADELDQITGKVIVTDSKRDLNAAKILKSLM